MMYVTRAQISVLRLLDEGTATVKPAAGRGKESVVVNAKQQLGKVRACLVTSYT